MKSIENVLKVVGLIILIVTFLVLLVLSAINPHYILKNYELFILMILTGALSIAIVDKYVTNVLSEDIEDDKDASKLVRKLLSNNKNKVKVNDSVVEQYREKNLSIHDINKYVSNYNTDEFKKSLFEKFKEIITFSNKDTREYVTDEFYNYLKSSDMLKYDQVKYCNLVYNTFLKEDSLIYIQTSILFTVEGSKLKNYDVTFVKNIVFNDIKCPNCGNDLPDKATDKCPYCNSVIVSKSSEWVISDMKEEKNEY